MASLGGGSGGSGPIGGAGTGGFGDGPANKRNKSGGTGDASATLPSGGSGGGGGGTKTIDVNRTLDIKRPERQSRMATPAKRAGGQKGYQSASLNPSPSRRSGYSTP